MVPEDDESATESESEVEEDCDLWLDEAGRQWMRTTAFPGKWYLLGTGFDGSTGGTSPVRGSWGVTWGSRLLWECRLSPGTSSCASSTVASQ